MTDEPFDVFIARHMTEQAESRRSRRLKKTPRAPIGALKVCLVPENTGKHRKPYGATWREFWEAKKEDVLRSKPAKKRERAKRRTAKRKAKDCRTIVGIETIAADPCAYCGAPVATTHDHIEPFSRGGTHDLSNVARCCWRCNKEKGTRSLLMFLAVRANRRAA